MGLLALQAKADQIDERALQRHAGYLLFLRCHVFTYTQVRGVL